MTRRQLPKGIEKTTVTNRRTGKLEPRWRVQLNLGTARRLPLPDDVVTVLRAARTGQQRVRLAAGSATGGGEYVASDELGQPYTPSQISDAWARMLSRLGIGPVRLHDARHTCGTLMHLQDGATRLLPACMCGATGARTRDQRIMSPRL